MTREDPAFLAELGHELRTPLAAMIGFAEAMAGEAFGPLGETYREHAALIAAAGRHLDALATELLALEPRPVERFDLAAMAGEAVALLQGAARAAGVTVALASPPSTLDVIAVPGQVRQILLNLMANAVAATPRGGSVLVNVAAEPASLHLRVADTGPGPPATDAPVGRGLGLPIVRRLCAAHDGTLTFSAAAGGGTVASVILAQRTLEP